MFIREGYISEGLESFNSSLNKYLAVAQTQYIQSVSAGVGGAWTNNNNVLITSSGPDTTNIRLRWGLLLLLTFTLSKYEPRWEKWKYRGDGGMVRPATPPSPPRAPLLPIGNQ